MATNQTAGSPKDGGESIIQPLREIIRGMSDTVVGHVAYDAFTWVLKEELVCAAHRRLLKNNHGNVTQARIGLMTGISPESIREILGNTSNREPPPLSNYDRILLLWAEDPNYWDPKSGDPAELLIHGGKGTFQGLVTRAGGRGITAKTALDDFVASGNVEVINTHWVRLSHSRSNSPSHEITETLDGLCHLIKTHITFESS